MSNIFKAKKKRFGSVELILGIIIFIVLLIWLNITFNKVKISTSAEQLNEATSTVQKAVVLCYSIEGAYPPSIDYLEKNYGLHIDDNRFFVHYDVIAANIMPNIIVFEKN